MTSGRMLRGTAVTFAAEIAGLLISVATSILLARALGPEGRGVYAVAMLLPAMVVSFGHLGLGTASTYLIARKKYSPTSVFATNLGFIVIVGALGLGAGAIAILLLADSALAGAPHGLLWLGLALVLPDLAISYTRYILLGLSRIPRYNAVYVAQRVLSLCFLIIALVALGAGVKGAVVAAVSARWLAAAISALLTARAVMATEGRFRFDIKCAKEALAYGVKFHLGGIVAFLNLRLDLLLVNSFLGVTQVGLYTVAVGLVEKLWLLPQAASAVLFPRIASEDDEARKGRITSTIVRNVLLISVVSGGIIVLIGRWLIPVLYGGHFRGSVGALYALMTGAVASSGSRVLGNDLAARGHPMLNTYFGIAALALNLGLNLWWIPFAGIAGAAWASSCSYLLLFVLRFAAYVHVSKEKWNDVLFVRWADLKLYKQGIRGVFAAIRSRALPRA